jgi:hypothetical protein
MTRSRGAPAPRQARSCRQEGQGHRCRQAPGRRPCSCQAHGQARPQAQGQDWLRSLAPRGRLVVYRIACRKLRAVYIGQTSDLARRVLQHLARPPIPMRHDLQCCRPLARHFQTSVLKQVQTRAYADAWEAQLIAEHRAAGFSLYNRLG